MQEITRSLPVVLFIAIIALVNPRLSLGQTDESYDVLLSKGITGLQQNDLGAALADFKSALAERPDGVQAHYYIAVTHARANRVVEAEVSFKKAIEIERTFIPAHFDLGVLYYQTRNDEKALKSFALVERIDPERARVYFYQGVILKRQGNEKEGELKLEKAVSLDPELAAEIYFLSGASEFQSGDFDSAKKEFQGVLTLTPEGELADSAREFISQIDAAPKQKKRLLLSASLGLQYDDNVILEPRQASALPSGITSKSDLVSMIYLRAQYEWLKRGKWSGDLEFTYFLNYHQDNALSDFDIQDTHLSTSIGRRYGKNELQLQYEFQAAFLAGQSFLVNHKVGPGWIHLHSKKQMTELSYFYGDKGFKNGSNLFKDNSDRDVETHHLALTHYLRFHEEGSVYGGYSLNIERAGNSDEEDDWSFEGHHLKAGIVFPAWRDITTSFELNATYRQYDNENEVTQKTLKIKRKDDEFLSILSFSKPLRANLNLTAQYLYQDNDSNIDPFAYRRSIFGLIVTAKY